MLLVYNSIFNPGCSMRPLGFGAKERTRGQERSPSGLFSFGARNGTCTKSFATADNTPFLQGIQRETKKEAFLLLFWKPGTGLGWKGRQMPSTNSLKDCSGHKKRRPNGLLFWCPEQERLNCLLLSLTVCYFFLYNYYQIQIDTTKTGKTSERWPKYGQGE